MTAQTLSCTSLAPSRNNAPTTLWLGQFFVIAALLPWLSFSLNKMDSQPWPILAGLLFLSSLKKIHIPTNILWAACALLAAIPFAVLQSKHISSFDTLRAIAGYTTILVSFIAFHNYMNLFGFPKNIFRIIGLLWIVFGIIEIYHPNILEFLSPTRTSLDRGVTSLSPEPTFFAIYLFFSSWILLCSSGYKANTFDYSLCLLNIASILFLAKSFMGAFYIMVCAAIAAPAFFLKTRAFLHFNSKSLMAFLCMLILIAGISLTFSNLEGTRLHTGISRYFSASMLNSVSLDASINQRFEAIALSLHSFLANLGMPGGFDTFYEKKTELSVYWGNTFWHPIYSNKILSWAGSILYELGLFGLVFIIALFAGIKKNRCHILETSVLAILLLSAIPHGFPLVAMLLALWSTEKTEEHHAPA